MLSCARAMSSQFKMIQNGIFLVFIFLVITVSCTYAQRDKKFFRKDYKFIEATESFYKIHTIHRSWYDAQKACRLEGATMFYPDDQLEADEVRNYWNKTQPFSWVYIGISDLIAVGVFETIDGHPISEVYDNWGPGEPNDAYGAEDCVILRRDGTLNDVDCELKYPFICKKTLTSLEWNSFCSMPNLDYIYDETLGKCYKFHLDPMSWQEAYATCAAELSYLAIINSQAEAEHLINVTANAPKDNVPGDYLRGAVHLGFHKRSQGWTTIKGTELDDSGYTKWSYMQPDNAGGEEKCGTMFYNGELNDLNCSHKCFFICEHDVDILQYIFDVRLGSE